MRIVCLPAILVLAAAIGCAPEKKPEPAPVAVKGLTVNVSSDPGKAMLVLSGKPVGETPQSFKVGAVEDLFQLSATLGQEGLVEKRIKFLSGDQVEVNFVFGAGRSTMAKVLGIPRILVFDYGTGVTFNVNRADLKAEFLPLLERQATILDTHFPALDVFVCGHTDSQGAKDFNLSLSLDRARAVAGQLESRGVKKARLKVQGFGSDFPVAANDAETGRAMNRRTEVILPQ